LRADQFVDKQKSGARRAAWCLCAAFLLSLFSLFAGLSAASAETRTLKIYHIHTGEKVEITFKRNGRYLNDGLNKLNRALRDWRRNEPTRMDPRLLDTIWEVYKKSGSRGYIHVIGGYRSPATNSMLRKRSKGVAKESQHMKGKAMDFFIPGVSLKKLRYSALQIGTGGVGYYPRSGSPFVHVDVGSVRHWPRMSRSELMAVFPGGKTMHVPSDGRPLAGYQVAEASYKSRLKTGSSAKFDNSSSGSGGGKSLLAALFGGGADEEEDTAADEEGAPVKPAKPVKEEVLVAAAPAQKPKKPAEEKETLVAALPQRTTPAPLAVVRPQEDLKPEEEVSTEALAFAVPVPGRKPRTNPVLTAPSAEAALAARMATGEKPSNEQAMVQMAAADPQAEAEAIRAALGGTAPAEQAVAAAEAEPFFKGSVPVPMRRPAVEEAEVVIASVAVPTARPVISDAIEEPLVAMAEPAATAALAEEVVEVSLAPESSSANADDEVAKLLASEDSIDPVAVADTGVKTTDKGAKPKAGEGRKARKPVVVPVTKEVGQFALTKEPVTQNGKEVVAVTYGQETVWQAPTEVYVAGFSTEAPQNVNKFSGKAVNFLKVAKFKKLN
jgi:uncharacterized protein YcbK (DUF882 family)